MSRTSKNARFMNGVPELLILRQLATGEMYGYQLVRAIHTGTGNAINLSEGCVYPLLHALERKGWLSSRRAAADGRTRVYYRLTPKGLRRLDEMSGEWSSLAAVIGNVLGASHGKAGTV